MEWKTVKNLRKLNGDLGDVKCDYCGGQSGAYVTMNGIMLICKGCLLDAVDKINETILNTPDIRVGGFDEEEIDKETVKMISSF